MQTGGQTLRVRSKPAWSLVKLIAHGRQVSCRMYCESSGPLTGTQVQGAGEHPTACQLVSRGFPVFCVLHVGFACKLSITKGLLTTSQAHCFCFAGE